MSHGIEGLGKYYASQMSFHLILCLMVFGAVVATYLLLNVPLGQSPEETHWLKKILAGNLDVLVAVTDLVPK